MMSIGSVATELLQRASIAYECGRYEECERALQQGKEIILKLRLMN